MTNSNNDALDCQPMGKIFLQEDEIIQDAFRLGVKIFESGFHPTFIVGLWRGGSTVGIYVQECLQTLGVQTDHIALRTSYKGLPAYQEMVENPQDIRVHGTQYLAENLNAEDSLLIVDDCFSSGYNVSAVIRRLQKHLKKNMPAETKIASLWQRPEAKKADVTPDFVLHTTDKWLVFPYELQGLSRDEIEANKPVVASILS